MQPSTANRKGGRVLRIAAAVLVAGAACLTVAPPALGSPAAPAAARTTARTSGAPAPNPAALPVQPAWTPLVQQLYQAILNRPADAGGIAYWGGLLDSGAPAAAVTGPLVRSPEQLRADVTAAHQSLLHRTPDPGGLSTWTDFLAVGHSVEQLWATLAGYPEFRHVNPTSADQVAAAYKTVLDRAPDPGGATFWADFLDKGGHPSDMVTMLTRSSEYARRVVTSAYQQALFRTPDQVGLAYWMGLLEAGRSDALSLLATLAATPESVNFGCDPNQPDACLLPYPNDLYTHPDSTTATGKRVAIKPSWTPTNVGGTHIDPTQLNRSDGFSPGAATILRVPGVDLQKTQAPAIDTPKTSLDPTSPIVVFDEATGKRVPVWAELDQFNNPGANPTLYIRPAVNYLEGHTYVIALRDMKNGAGATIPAPPVFAAYRDGKDLPGVGGFEARKPHMDQVLNAIKAQGIDTSTLYLAWDFTVASTANLTGRLIHIRDDAFSTLGGLNSDGAPSFTVTSVTGKTPQDPNAAEPYPGIARVVQGTFQMPKYLTGNGGPGTVFNTGSNGLPQRNGTMSTDYMCIIPDQALQTPGIPSVYGHGLFGSMDEVASSPQRAMATRFGRVYCATPELGMTQDDVPTAITILSDLSKFDMLPDRVQQGMVAELFLGRLLNSPGGFNTNAAFQGTGNSASGVIAPHEVTYDGNSQGGILGGLVTTVATDWTRGVLGVAAMNFSTLMDRSSDFTPFFQVLNGSYPKRLDQVIAIDLIQGEWDRGEPDGYVAHVTNDPLPNTPSHHVLMQIAYGDFQVTNWATDVEARTIGQLGGGNMHAECPPTQPNRTLGDWPLWNVPCIASYPYDGSAIVYLDSGSTPPPLGNLAPTTANGNRDPHGDPRSFPAMQDQKDQFLRPNGVVNEACTGPCVEPAPS